MFKNPPANAGGIRDVGSILGSGRSPGSGHGNPLQYSFLETPMDKGDCWTVVHSIAESDMEVEWGCGLFSWLLPDQGNCWVWLEGADFLSFPFSISGLPASLGNQSRIHERKIKLRKHCLVVPLILRSLAHLPPPFPFQSLCFFFQVSCSGFLAVLTRKNREN